MAKPTMSDSTSDSSSGGDAFDSSTALQPGDRLGGYRLLHPVARGGMGQIWAGQRLGRRRMGSLVAIKTALIERDPHCDKLEELFLDEARLAISIDHPNVCRTYELGDERGVLFLAMEWIDGASLWQLHRAQPPPRRLNHRVAAHIVAHACAGLHAVHELRGEDGGLLHVVHRDATPHNILISSNGEIKIVDFGVAKSRVQLHATVTGEFKGKINYLAPEQVLGSIVDRRADVFALGCVLYLLTTGERPFHAENAGGIMLRIVNGDYELPSRTIPDFPVELEAIVVRALALDPANRFTSAAVMRDALLAFAAKKAGPPIEHGTLSALLAGRLGDSIDQRRKQIRHAQRRFDSLTDDTPRSLSASPAATGSPSVAAGVDSSSTNLGTAASVPCASGNVRTRRLRNLLLYGAIGGLITAAPLAVVALAKVTQDPSLSTFLARVEFDIPPIPPHPASPAVLPPPAPQPELITLSIRANPANAVVVIDSGPPMPSPHTFTPARDTNEHVIVVRADGHEPVSRPVRFDQSQSLDVVLSPLPPTPSRDSQRKRSWARTVAPKAAANSDPPDTAPAAAAQEPADVFATSSSRKKRRAIDESDPFSE